MRQTGLCYLGPCKSVCTPCFPATSSLQCSLPVLNSGSRCVPLRPASLADLSPCSARCWWQELLSDASVTNICRSSNLLPRWLDTAFCPRVQPATGGKITSGVPSPSSTSRRRRDHVEGRRGHAGGARHRLHSARGRDGLRAGARALRELHLACAADTAKGLLQELMEKTTEGQQGKVCS